MSTSIRNISTVPLALPEPYEGMLPANAVAVVGDAAATAQSALGGMAFTSRLLRFDTLPSGAALTPHGANNIDETLTTTAPICSVVAPTTRFDVKTAGGSVTATVPNGRYFGQRKRMYYASALTTSTVTITPNTVAESRTNAVMKSLDSWVEMEWQVAGWKFIGAGGATGAASNVVLT